MTTRHQYVGRDADTGQPVCTCGWVGTKGSTSAHRAHIAHARAAGKKAREAEAQVTEILADSQPDDCRDWGHQLEAAGNPLGRQIIQALDLFLANPAMTSVLFDDGTRIVRYGSVESFAHELKVGS